MYPVTITNADDKPAQVFVFIFDGGRYVGRTKTIQPGDTLHAFAPVRQ